MPEFYADLTGVRAKLARAKEHLCTLDDMLLRLSEEYASTSFIKFDFDGSWHIVSINPIPQFPLRLALIAGDFFVNCRAVLDHLVWQLVLREGKKPSQSNSFPIFDSEDDFVKKVKSPPKKFQKRSPLYGIPVDGDAWEIIERAQPWNHSKIDGLQPSHDMLVSVARLSNHDKHRTILVSMPITDQNVLAKIIRWAPADVQPLEMWVRPWHPVSHEHPREVMRIRFPSHLHIRMYLDNRLAIGPTFGDDKIQVGGLRPIFERVCEIVEDFARLPRVKG